jgi:hypothetical protein
MNCRLKFSLTLSGIAPIIGVVINKKESIFSEKGAVLMSARNVKVVSH